MKARRTIALKRIARDGLVDRLASALERGRRGKAQEHALEHAWPQQYAAKGKVPPP
jgi:hypothetical protein